MFILRLRFNQIYADDVGHFKTHQLDAALEIIPTEVSRNPSRNPSQSEPKWLNYTKISLQAYMLNRPLTKVLNVEDVLTSKIYFNLLLY